MNLVLNVKNITKSYKDFSLSNISFSLKEGEIMGLLGPNGSGKTTLIKIIMNLVKPSKGNVEVFGNQWKSNEIDIKNRIAFVSDENHIPDHLTPLHIEKLMKSFFKKKWDTKMYHYYLDKYDITLKKKIGNFSKGMKMKVSLAIALSHHPELVVMDEPTAGLDPLTRDYFIKEIKKISKDSGKSFLLSSHLTSDLEKIVDSITILNKGNLICSCNINDLFKHNQEKCSLNDIFLSLLKQEDFE